MDIEALLELVVQALEDLKAQEVRVIDVREKTPIMDVLVIASGLAAAVSSPLWGILGDHSSRTAMALAAGGAEPLCWDDSAEARDQAGAAGLTLHDLSRRDAFEGLAALLAGATFGRHRCAVRALAIVLVLLAVAGTAGAALALSVGYGLTSATRRVRSAAVHP